MTHQRFLIALLLALVSLPTIAVKPRWVGNTPKPLNNTYQFVEVVSYGTSVSDAREIAKQLLATNEQLKRAVSVNTETGRLTHIDQQLSNGQMEETVKTDVYVKMDIKGAPYRLQANIVDEYVAEQKHGHVKLHTLYMVAVADNPVFDCTHLTTSYGLAPAVMSVIPGVGQMYKGSTLKGVCMLGGTAAVAVGALFCENQRADYKNKMKEQPKFAQSYNTKANNYETARNICLGAAGALWVYNIIDAAVAKGARRVKVSPSGRQSFSLTPMFYTEGTGVSLCYHF